MSEEVLGFVDEWISEHVRPGEHTSDDNNTQAKALAQQCLADASAQGISELDIKDAIDDLTEFMAAAIEEANEREAHRLGEDEEDDDDEDDADDGGAEPAAGSDRTS
jgi:hypothetical protein